MADDTARLVAVLEADIKNFTKGMDQAKAIADKRFGQIEQRIRQNESVFSSSFAEIGAGFAGLLSVRAIGEFVSSISEAAEKLQSLSERTGISVEAIQKLDAAGRAAGINQAEINDSLDKFAKFLGQAAHGQGDLAKVMRDDGIKVGSDLIATYLNVADAVKNAKTREEEYRITQAALGKGSAELVGFLRQGSAAVREQMDAFKGGLTAQTVRDLADFNKSWKEIGVSFSNLAAGPASFVLAGFGDFLKTLDQGNWEQKLQALASFFSGGIIAQPAVGLDKQIAAAGHELDLITERFMRARDLRAEADATGTIGFGIPKDSDIQRLATEMTAQQQKVAALVKQRLAAAPAPPDKASGGGFQGDPELAAKEVARTLAAAKAAQAALAQATSAANAESLRDTEAYYAEVRKGAQDASVAAILAANEKAKAEIAALDETKIGHEAFAKAVENINQTAAAEESAIFEKRRLEIGKIDQEELQTKRAASERLVAIEEQRAAAIARVNEGAAQSSRDLIKAKDQLAIERASGTSGIFDVQRKAAEDEADAQRTVIKEQEVTEIASLARLREERVKSGADGVSIWQDYETAVQTLHAKTANDLAAVDAKITEQQLQILEAQNHAKQDAINLADEARAGLEDIGIAAVHGFSSFRDAASRALESVADLILKLYVLKPLVEGVLGPTGTKLGGTGIIGAIQGIGSFLGLAGGGNVFPGQPVIVGERRPELFVPSVAGRIVPNVPQAMAHNGAVTVAQTFQVDARGAQEGVAEQIANALAKAAPSFVDTSVRAVKRAFPGMVVDYTKRWG